MNAFSANTDDPARLVVFVTYPDIVLLDLVGPLQVFSHALTSDTGTNGYRCAVASMTGGTIPTNTVVPIPTVPLSDFATQDIHTLIIVGGDGANTAMVDQSLLTRIRSLADRASRVCSVCSGALVLAATGLLDGRRAVTHWDDCDTLRDSFPLIRVEIDPIYIKDGHVWTSAGITAGIDMALAIVAEDLGHVAAMQVARSMVAQMVRSGGQSQYSPVLDRQLSDTAGKFDALHHWISENLHRDLTVETLAQQVNMSARSFARNYAATMGQTPAKAVVAIRTETARHKLETTDLGIKQIAASCGFRDEERMRRAFLRLMGVTPTAYRQGFRVGSPEH